MEEGEGERSVGAICEIRVKSPAGQKKRSQSLLCCTVWPFMALRQINKSCLLGGRTMDNAQEKYRREGDGGRKGILSQTELLSLVSTVYCFSLASTLSLCPSPSPSLGSVSFRFYAF